MIVTTGGWARKQEPASAFRNRPAVFEKDGSLHLPDSYRQWEHVGTRIKPDGRSVLDGSQITTPQVMDTYVAPAAFDSFKKTGTWPEGTQIVKEISLIKIGKDCDKKTFVCSTSFGSGIFQASYIGMGMMVNERKRFPSEPGIWGFFAFRSNGSDLSGHCNASPSAAVRILPYEACVEHRLRLLENAHWAVIRQYAVTISGTVVTR